MSASTAAGIDRAALWLALGLWGLSTLPRAGALFTATGPTEARLGIFIISVTVWGLVLTGLLHRHIGGRVTSATWRSLIGAVLIVTIAQAIIDHLIWMLCREFKPRPFRREVAGVLLNVLTYIWLFGVYVVLLKLRATRIKASEHERQADAAMAAAQSARLGALRAQLNPHFLFNGLNALSGLIVTGRSRQADDMLVKLATFLRFTLVAQDRALNTLAHELEAADAYLDIERVRFGGLHPTIDCPAPLRDALVPSLILQPLLENAVKYAVEPSQGAASVHVTVRESAGMLEISVIDDGAPNGPPGAGAGIGLANTRERLAALYGEQASLLAGPWAQGYRARLRFPLRRAAQQETTQASMSDTSPIKPRSGSNRW